MLNPFKKGHQYNVAKNSFVIRINLLDGTSTEFNLQPNVTGNDCLDKVAQTLEMDLQEVDYHSHTMHHVVEMIRTFCCTPSTMGAFRDCCLAC